MIKQYRKKPVVISAVQWTGENFYEVTAFMHGDGLEQQYGDDSISIYTLEGKMQADKGDYIIRGVNGEFYPCKPDIFEKTYEELSDDDQREHANIELYKKTLKNLADTLKEKFKDE